MITLTFLFPPSENLRHIPWMLIYIYIFFFPKKPRKAAVVRALLLLGAWREVKSRRGETPEVNAGGETRGGWERSIRKPRKAVIYSYLMLVCVTLHTWNQVSNRFYMLLIVLLLFVLLHYSWRYSTWQYGFFIFLSAIQWGWTINRSLFFGERVFCWILGEILKLSQQGDVILLHACFICLQDSGTVLRLTSEPCPEAPRNAIGAGRTVSAPLGWLWRHPQSLRRRWTTQAGATWSERNLNHGTMRMYLLHGCVHDMSMELISSVKAICFPHKFHKIWRAERPKKTSFQQNRPAKMTCASKIKV